MATVEGQLLARVLADPDDTDARIVYADYLVERGDPRGELIHVQCALAAPNVSDRDALEKQVIVLIRAALPAWRTAAGLEAEHVVEWDRGFPTNILESPGGLSARWFVKVAPDLARRIPLTRLSLMYTDRATCEQLCILPELSQLRELSLNGHMGADQGSDPVPALAAAQHLTRLRILALSGHTIDAPGVQALLASSQLAALEDLTLGFAELDKRGIETAILHPAATRLRALDLRDNRLTASGARLLAVSPFLAGLQKLGLERCRLQARGGQYILDSKALPALQSLSLCDNALGAGGGVRVGPTLSRTLTELDLSCNDLDDHWAQRFVDHAPLEVLTSLKLRVNQLDIAGVMALLAAPSLRALDTLLVSSPRNIEGWGRHLGQLASLPALARIKRLDAERTGVSDHALAQFVASPHVRGLRRLRLSFNPITAVGASALADSPNLEALEALELYYTPLDDQGVEALCNSTTLTGLRHLALSTSSMGDRGLRALAATRAFPGLRRLTLYGATPGSRAALANALGVIVDIGDSEQSMGLHVDPAWT